MCALATLALPLPTFAQSASIEGKIKAAFVFNFIKFVDWPETAFASTEAPIKLCVWGDNALDGALDTLRTKTAKKRPIQLLYIRNQSEVRGCHVLFATNVDRQSLITLVKRTAGKSVLTVSDISGFAASGGIIGLYRSSDRMRFAINVTAARQSGLRISSQLLKLGKIVAGEGQ